MVRPAGSHALEQQLQIERRALSQILDVRRQEGLGRPATFVSQHAQKIPLGVELRGVAEACQGASAKAGARSARTFLACAPMPR
jgi:hypothetical protein